MALTLTFWHFHDAVSIFTRIRDIVESEGILLGNLGCSSAIFFVLLVGDWLRQARSGRPASEVGDEPQGEEPVLEATH